MLKTKINLKILVALAMVILAVLVFNTNTVNATTLTQEEIQAMLDVIPDEIVLENTEIEYEKSWEELDKRIRKIWEENNMDLGDANVYISGGLLYSEKDFYRGSVSIGGTYKDISLVYSNTAPKDLSTQENIKNMTIESPKYYEIDLNDWKNSDSYYSTFIKTAERYYSNLIKGEGITVKVTSGAGELGPLGGGGTIHIGIFKDGNFYDTRFMKNESILPVINISSTIADENIIEYLTNSLQEVYNFGENDNKEKVLEVKEGNDPSETYVNIGDVQGLYTVKTSYEGLVSHQTYEKNSVVIVRRVIEPTEVIDAETNIKLEAEAGVLPSNVVLEVAPVTEGTVYNTVKKVLSNMKQFKIFDINLLSDGVKIQPNGKVKISIPVPAEFNKENLVVYRVEENGDKAEYSVAVNGDLASFETDHFSTYVLAEKAVAPEKEKDDTPKTGTVEGIYFILPITIISALGIIAFRKRETK